MLDDELCNFLNLDLVEARERARGKSAQSRMIFIPVSAKFLFSDHFRAISERVKTSVISSVS